jgi:eukaryotic-like serine/threonine-protein kinase
MTQTETRPRGGGGIVRCPESSELPCRIRQWELLELAAEGALARVYRARPAASSQQPAAYAVKMLRPEWHGDPRAAHLLAREAMVGRSVTHPHVVAILGSSLKVPPRFLVMPWLEGATLRAMLDRRAPPDLPEALWFARQAAEGLDAIQRRGWMHGDIKPSNLFVSCQGHVTLLDLGFARRADETGAAVDRCVLGTGNYLAPEWITSRLRADIRSDIYSLGVVLFEMLCGQLPFKGSDLAELATQHLRAAVPNPRRLAPHLPGEVADLMLNMLAKDPLRRPQTPQELVERLSALEIATFSERAWQ